MKSIVANLELGSTCFSCVHNNCPRKSCREFRVL